MFRLRIKSTQTDANASFPFTLRVHASKRFSQIEFRSRARTKKFFPLSRETTTTEKKEGEICAQRKMSKSKHVIIDAISYLHNWHVQNGLHAGNASNRCFRHRSLVRVLLGGGVTDSRSSTYARTKFFSFFFLWRKKLIFFSFSPLRGVAVLCLTDHRQLFHQSRRRYERTTSVVLPFAPTRARKSRRKRTARISPGSRSLSLRLSVSLSPFFLLLFVFSSFHDFFHASALRTRNEGKRS